MSAGERQPPVRPAPKRRTVFSIVTVALGVIAIVLLVWRISKAWRIEYGGAPRGPQGIPTGGSFGPPGGPAASGGPAVSGGAGAPGALNTGASPTASASATGAPSATASSP